MNGFGEALVATIISFLPDAASLVAVSFLSPPEQAASTPADGATPWNEDEAKREARRLKALERKRKRAEKRGE